MTARANQPKAKREGRILRLSAEDWVAAGFRALVAGGASALKVEPLSRSLGATKGSFYWHFSDGADLRTQMIKLWRRLGEAEITGAIRARGLKGRAALAALIERISVVPHDQLGGAAVEPAIRAWALEDLVVARAVADMDKLRIDVLREFFAQTGLTTAQAMLKAKIFYASVVGLEMLRLTSGADMRACLMAELDTLLAAPRQGPKRPKRARTD
ncbi:MAG: TetR/AcrR family transcriptional regulator [Hyphomonadaceae bacterium]|nr:TetR/AcrR family transcriptional regulator [Hyphomonadaceae bacterium]